MLDYDPLNWYWLADDGRLYSSRTGTLVTPNSDDFIDWKERGGYETRWPVDDDGLQTDSSLGEVLSVYGMTVATTPGAIDSLNLETARAALSEMIESTAKSKGYDSGVSCTSYYGSTNSVWAAEAHAFVAWRDSIWEAAFAALAVSPSPSFESFRSTLPVIQWPESSPE